MAECGVNETAAKVKQSNPNKVNADEESPLKKLKNTMTGFAPALVEEMKELANEKLADETNKLIEGAHAPAEEEEEEGDRDGDDKEDGGEEAFVVEETQPEESDPVLKTRKKSRLGVV